MRHLTLLAALLVSASPVLAQVQPPRTIDMTTPLHNESGEPLKDANSNTTTHIGPDGKFVLDDPKCDKCPVLTVGRLVANALFNVPEKDAKPDELWARGALAERIRDDKAAALTADEIAKIEKLVAVGYPSPMIIMQVFPVLDPNAKPAALKP